MMRIDMKKREIVYKELSYKITGILFRIANELDRYKNEKQYCDAIEHLFKKNGIRYEREKILPVSFTGERAGRNKADFIVDDKIILEIKAKPFITRNDYYQTMRYLKASNKRLGILVNMSRNAISPKRVLNSDISGQNSHN